MADQPQFNNYYFTNMDGVTVNPGSSGCITLDTTSGIESVVAEVMSHQSLHNNSSMDALEELKMENVSNDCWFQSQFHLSESALCLDQTPFGDILAGSNNAGSVQQENNLWDYPQEQKATPQEQAHFPPQDSTDLSNQDYPGPYNFKVVINPPGIKSPWEYSQSLNKIYTDVSRKFPLSFRVEKRTPENDLYVRATPVFEEAQHSQEFVYRCISHLHPGDPTNVGVDANKIQHIMRCQNERTLYNGDKFRRLNCVIPLGFPGEGTTDVTELFQFVCKNSCASTSGMNRRPIQVIFTLEDCRGKIWGRRVINFRICSVPKRDRKKEESDRERAANPTARVANPTARAANPTARAANLPARTANFAPARNAGPADVSKRRKVDGNTSPDGKSKPCLTLSYHKANGEVDSLDIRLVGSIVTDVLKDIKKRVADSMLGSEEAHAPAMGTYEKLEALINLSKNEDT